MKDQIKDNQSYFSVCYMKLPLVVTLANFQQNVLQSSDVTCECVYVSVSFRGNLNSVSAVFPL